MTSERVRNLLQDTEGPDWTPPSGLGHTTPSVTTSGGYILSPISDLTPGEIEEYNRGPIVPGLDISEQMRMRLESRPNWFQFVVSPFVVPGTWATQLMGAYEDNLRAARGMAVAAVPWGASTERGREMIETDSEFRWPEFSTYGEAAMGIYPNVEDIGLSASFRSRTLPGSAAIYAAEELLRGPETDENQFWTSSRMVIPDEDAAAQWQRGVELTLSVLDTLPEDHPGNILNNWLGRAAIQATTLGPAIFNEQVVFETLNDPLVIAEAFGFGARIINSINRGAGAARRGVPALDVAFSGVRRFRDRVMTESWREVYRAARPILGESAYRREIVRGELQASELAVREAGGPAWMRDTFFEGEISPRITKLWEETPRAQVSALHVAEDVPGVAGEAVGTAIDDIMELVAGEFPEAPPLVQRGIAEFLDDAWRYGETLPNIENFWGIPTQRWLGDAQYAQHSYTPGARRAAYRSLPTWQQRREYDFLNRVGKDVTATLEKRKLRTTITNANELAAQGRLGFVDGKLKILSVDEAAQEFAGVPIRPDNWQPVDKLFIDNPWAIMHSRYGQHTRAVAAAQMLTEASQNPNFVKAATATDFPRIPDIIGESSFSRTFGRLGGDLEGIAQNTRWQSKEIAQGVIDWSMVARDVQNRPNAILNILDVAIATWRGMTLTPFLSYHNRNLVGGLLNNLMSGTCDIFDIIDATFPTRGIGKIKGQTAGHWEGFRRQGLHRTNEIGDAWASHATHVYDAPLLGSPIQSHWDLIKGMNPFGEGGIRQAGRSAGRFLREVNPLGKGGRTVGQAIENHQRFAQYLGSVRRGIDDLGAATNTYKYHFDYFDVPRWFRKGTWARRAASFPTWTLKNIPLQLEHMVTTPTKFGIRGRMINSIIKASGRANEPMPEYIERQQGFPEPGGFLALENFDPAAGIGELAQVIGPLLQGEPEQARSAATEFVLNLMNPFITEIPEQLMQTAPVGTIGEPGGHVPGIPFVTEEEVPEFESTGWDFFFRKPVFREYKQWGEEWSAFGVEGRMPEWAQRGDHALRSFVRAYNEITGTMREFQRMNQDTSPYEGPDYMARRGLGIPFFRANRDQTIYFKVRDSQREIAAIHADISDDTATDSQLTDLKDGYMAELGYLSHGTFLQLDPWDGNPRPWLNIAQDDEFTIKGQQKYWREYIETCYLLLYGRRGMGTTDVHQPIPMDDSERELIEGMMDAALQSYVVLMHAYAARGDDVNVGTEERWIENRSEPPETD